MFIYTVMLFIFSDSNQCKLKQTFQESSGMMLLNLLFVFVSWASAISTFLANTHTLPDFIIIIVNLLSI